MRTWIALASASILAAGQDYKPENKPENLKALFSALLKASRGGDAKTAAALTKSLLGDEARLRKALRDDVPADFPARIAAQHKKLLDSPEERLAGAFEARPEQTEIQVHGATTEDIAKNEKDSVAWKEFPGGARKLAQTHLRPGLTFYEVEFLEPGKDAGMKYHLFFWDGERWAMLGPAWRWGQE